MRHSVALVAVALLAGCGGGSDESAVPPPPDSTPHLASGKSLPAGCPPARPRAKHLATFAAGGRAWALSLDGKELLCLFEAPAPGPFAWGPRGDRLLLDGLGVEGLGKAPRRAADDVHPVSSSWGHPVGKSVVFVAPDGAHLLKARPGRSDFEDVTPMRKAIFRKVAYHPSGLAFGFIIERKGRQELWLSSNTGAKPKLLVHGRLHTSFDALAFSVDGRAIFFAARHADGTPHVHRIDLDDPVQVGTMWHGKPGTVVHGLLPAWESGIVALTIGSTCAHRRAVVVDGDASGGRRLLPSEKRPTRVVGWARDDTLLVVAGGCGQREDLSAVTLAGRVTPLVSNVEAAAVRRAEPLPAPPLPERQFGSGFA
jgi:hypothetical protein